jgi:hypothetical protein
MKKIIDPDRMASRLPIRTLSCWKALLAGLVAIVSGGKPGHCQGPLNGIVSGTSVQQTSDGGFVVIGQTSDGSGGTYLLRTDAQGKALAGWPKTFPGSGSGKSGQQTDDGGFVVAGSITVGTGNTDVYLLRTDAQGSVLSGWPKTFGGMGSETVFSVHQNTDNGFIVAGSVSSGGSDVYLLRTDAQGNALPGWPKTFGGIGIDIGHSVRQTGDGGFIVTGYTTSSGAGTEDVYLLRTDAQGNALSGWPKTFGGPGKDRGYSVEQTKDGGFIVTGQTIPTGKTVEDVYLIKTDANGNVQ